jgi:ABC-type arginine/histidine transport system permease subunit
MKEPSAYDVIMSLALVFFSILVGIMLAMIVQFLRVGSFYG